MCGISGFIGSSRNIKIDNLSTVSKMLKKISHRGPDLVDQLTNENDKVIFTSKGFFWNFPGTKLNKQKSIYVLPENHKKFDRSLGYVGICSDYINKYKKKVQNIKKK